MMELFFTPWLSSDPGCPKSVQHLLGDVMRSVPNPFEEADVIGKELRDGRQRMGPAPQLTLILVIGFEPRESDEVTLPEMGQAGQIERAQGETQFAAAEQLVGESNPTLVGQFVGADIFVRQVGSGREGFGDDFDRRSRDSAKVESRASQ
jgi:hypothetical protein